MSKIRRSDPLDDLIEILVNELARLTAPPKREPVPQPSEPASRNFWTKGSVQTPYAKITAGIHAMQKKEEAYREHQERIARIHGIGR